MDNKTRKEIMKSALLLKYKFAPGKERTSQEIADILSSLNPDVKNINPIVDGAIGMHQSFVDAVNQAGGAGWELEELFDMTYLDLLSSLSTNRIRFCFFSK